MGMLFDKAKIAGLSSIFKIMDDVFPMVQTSLSKQDILGLIPTVIGYDFSDSTGFPAKYKFSNIKGSIIVPTDLASNVTEIHKFLYNDQNYTPSSEVLEKSNKILEIVGGEGKLDEAAASTTQDDAANTDDNTFVWSGNSSSTDNGYYDSNSGSTDYDNGGGADYDNGGGTDYDNGGGSDYDNGGGSDYDNGDGSDYDNGGGTDYDNGGGDDGGFSDGAAESGNYDNEE